MWGEEGRGMSNEDEVGKTSGSSRLLKEFRPYPKCNVKTSGVPSGQ